MTTYWIVKDDDLDADEQLIQDRLDRENEDELDRALRMRPSVIHVPGDEDLANRWRAHYEYHFGGSWSILSE